MKKYLIIATVQLATILAATNATAQGTAAAATTSKAAAYSTFSKKIDWRTIKPVLPVVVSERIQQKFEKEFKNVSHASWSHERNGYTVRFTSNGIQSKAFYTKHGYCESLIRYYSEKSLPAAVRHLVKSNYYDFDITLITEVRHNNHTAYLVTIADKTTWKVIRVQDGEMSIWESHIKA